MFPPGTVLPSIPSFLHLSVSGSQPVAHAFPGFLCTSIKEQESGGCLFQLCQPTEPPASLPSLVDALLEFIPYSSLYLLRMNSCPAPATVWCAKLSLVTCPHWYSAKESRKITTSDFLTFLIPSPLSWFFHAPPHAHTHERERITTR